MSGLDDVKKLLAEAKAALSEVKSPKELEAVQLRFLGRKGEVTSILRGLKDLPDELKKAVGAAANNARQELEELAGTIGEKFKTLKIDPTFDPTLPGISQRLGAIHIINKVMAQIVQSFQRMGFAIATGPDIETDYNNFEGLNFPPDHPARDMQDTFYVEGNLLLRTHTSPVQIRVMEKTKPPVKFIAPGKTFRNEAISARSNYVFHQVEGFLVDKGVSLADLKACLVAFCKDFFGEDIKLRFRPSYFPFTEPSAEVDITCFLCKGEGCQLCKYAGWLEILGCGMIDPNVLRNVNYDPEIYSGYAFGMGVERIAMLKYGIRDIRLLYENDIRFVRQFI